MIRPRGRDRDDLQPRKATDVNAFDNREVTYAAADGIWPIL
jgi:hypothetical protein